MTDIHVHVQTDYFTPAAHARGVKDTAALHVHVRNLKDYLEQSCLVDPVKLVLLLAVLAE